MYRRRYPSYAARSLRRYRRSDIGRNLRRYPSSDYYYQAIPRTPSSATRFASSYRAANEAQRAARKEMRMFGRGNYYADAGTIGGALIGGTTSLFTMGNPIPGALAGAYFGHAAGNAIAPFMPKVAGDSTFPAGDIDLGGMGAYGGGKIVRSGEAGVVTNGLMNIPGSGPHLVNFGSGAGQTIAITHREFVTNVYAPSNELFTNTQYNINPGLYDTFPWLSQLAQNFDEYTLVQCAFQFRSLVTDFAANSGQVGTVILATQYNNNDSPFTTSRQMLNYDGAMSCKTSQTDFQGVECDPSKLSMGVGKYIRTAAVTSGQDINTLDSGIFNLAIEGVPSTYFNQKMGELWVSYTVHLRKPKEYASLGLGIDTDIFLHPLLSIPQSPVNQITNIVSGFNANQLAGQTNSVGSTCTWAVVNQLLACTISFPPSASGSYEILLLMNAVYKDTVQSTAFPNARAGTYTSVGDPQNGAIAATGSLASSCNTDYGDVGVQSYCGLPIVVTPGTLVGATIIPDVISSIIGASRVKPPTRPSQFLPNIPEVSDLNIWTSYCGAGATIPGAVCGQTSVAETTPPILTKATVVVSSVNRMQNLVYNGSPGQASFCLHVMLTEGSTNSVQFYCSGPEDVDLALWLNASITVRQYNTLGNNVSGQPILVNKAGVVTSFPVIPLP